MALLEDVEHGGHGGRLEPEHARHARERAQHEDAAGGIAHQDAKKEHKTQLIAIVIGIVGVILTWAYIRSRNTQTTTTSGSAVGSNTGQVAGYGDGTGSSAASWYQTLGQYGNALTTLQNDLQSLQTNDQATASGFQTLLQNMQSEISQLTSSPTTSPPQSPGVTVPNAPSNMVGNLVSVVSEPGGGVDYVTSVGAVYSEGGAQYYGGTNPGGNLPGNPWNAGTIVSAQPLAGGGYSLINEQGQTYNFGPQAGQFNYWAQAAH